MTRRLWIAAIGPCLLTFGSTADNGDGANRGADEQRTDLQPSVWHTIDPVAAPWLLLEFE